MPAVKLRVNRLNVQREIVARVQTGRAEITRERAAARLTREITAEIEAQILGTQPAKS